MKWLAGDVESEERGKHGSPHSRLYALLTFNSQSSILLESHLVIDWSQGQKSVRPHIR